MAGPYHNLIEAITQYECAVFAFIQERATAHHGVHEPHCLQSDFESGRYVFIALSSLILDIIRLLGVFAALNQSGYELGRDFMVSEHP